MELWPDLTGPLRWPAHLGTFHELADLPHRFSIVASAETARPRASGSAPAAASELLFCEWPAAAVAGLARRDSPGYQLELSERRDPV
jgi:hypothetical protein